MKKYIAIFGLVIFAFNACDLAIYATENSVTNEIQAEAIEEVTEVESIQEENEEQKIEENTEINIENSSEIVEETEIMIAPYNLDREIMTVKEEIQLNPEECIGEMWLDTPVNHAVCALPDANKLTLAGWAVSNDTNSVLKLYVNGICWGNIERNVERKDVNVVKPAYVGTTPKAGFNTTIDISQFPAGDQLITIEQVSRYGKVISKSDVIINVKQKEYIGEMWLDTPVNHAVCALPDANKLTLAGWAVSNDTNSVLKLYVNGICWGNIERKVDRKDVNAAKPAYMGTTPKAGFNTTIDISQFPAGDQLITIEQVSRYGKVISKSDVMINVKQKEYTGEMWLDTPVNHAVCKLPDANKLTLSGWAVSNDTNSVLKLYVNGICWGNIERNVERKDVNAAKPAYVGTTLKAGFNTTIDISQFPEGDQLITIEQVSRYGKVISKSDVMINVRQKEYAGEMWLDTPVNHAVCKVPDTNRLTLSGWAVSSDTNSVLKLYVNGICWGNIERNVERKDVNAAKPSYAGTTPKAGFNTTIDISQFPEGDQLITIEQVSRYGKVISKSDVIINISTPDYPGEMWIDTPIQNKRYNSGVLVISGWAVTTNTGDYVSIYLDGVYQTGAERRQRNDVVSLYGTKFGLTSSSRPGFYSEIGIGNLTEGVHTLKVVHYSKYQKKIQESEVNFVISHTLTWGIDVSHHNGMIDWDAVRNSGVNFAILKIGEYRESSGKILVDDHFEEYYAACKSRGIAVGGYFYSYAFNPTEAAHEADACTAIISGKSFEMPIFFDIEDPIVTNAINRGATNSQNVTNAASTFCEIMKSRGYQAGIYSYRNFFYSYLNMPSLEKYNIWLAHYVNNTDYTGKYDIWQYTSSGSVPGISGNVDLNWCFKRY